MNFEEALAVNGLATRLEERWGQWGHISREAVSVCQQAAWAECSLDVNLRTMKSMLLFTMAEESCWELKQSPNINGRADDPTHWDVGPFQINVFWALKGIDKGTLRGLSDMRSWTGTMVPGNPAPFDGDPVQNGRMAAQVLKAWHGPTEEKVVHYTGKDHQDKRREDWRVFGPLFEAFFECYHP